jgi:N-dimethylarginine dimethylaminohydrolase
MLSKNEWDPLKTVIVGRAAGAQIPKVDRSLHCINYANLADTATVNVGAYPQDIVDQADEDLETLCDTLTSLGVEVLRPENLHCDYYNYCPRDSVLVYDQHIIACPQPLRSRQREYKNLESCFANYSNIQYIEKIPERTDDLYNIECINNPDVKALTEVEPAFDAANILRSNDDLFYLVSNTGNEQGLQWLQQTLPDTKVWPIRDIYSYAHIDSTVALLREGLMLLNPERIKSIDQLPQPLQKWDYIWAPEPVDLGHAPGYAMASRWVFTVNLLSVNPNLVIIEQHQQELARVLSQHNIESILLPGRHQRTLSGGFHCVTLDLERTTS